MYMAKAPERLQATYFGGKLIIIAMTLQKLTRAGLQTVKPSTYILRACLQHPHMAARDKRMRLWCFYANGTGFDGLVSRFSGSLA
jgi:hypothetical protein